MILAFGVLTAQVADIGYTETTFEPGVRVPIIMKGSAAERYGLMPGDMILEMDGKTVAPGAASVEAIFGMPQAVLSILLRACLWLNVVMCRTLGQCHLASSMQLEMQHRSL